jgi:hypothetical protein
VRVYPSIRDLLQCMDTAVLVLDAATIAEVIVGAVTPRAGRLSQNGLEASSWDVHFSAASKGYATPKPSIVAVSFEIRFAVKPVETQIDGDLEVTGILRLVGSCAYDPILTFSYKASKTVRRAQNPAVSASIRCCRAARGRPRQQ